MANESVSRMEAFACARGNPTAEEIRTIADLARAPLDWDHITAVCYAQGIAPMIYHNLSVSGVTALLPSAAVEGLQRSYYGNAARNSLLYEELGGVLKALRKENIDVIALKAPPWRKPSTLTGP